SEQLTVVGLSPTYGATLLGFNNDLQATSLTFPGTNTVNRSLTTIHGDEKIWSTATYHRYVYQSIQSDSLGRITRMADSAFAAREYDRNYAFDGLGELSQVDFGVTFGCHEDPDLGLVCSTTPDSTHWYVYDA